MRNVIHIGMHKTGTTSIQAYLRQNRAALSALGVDIPDFGGDGDKAQAVLGRLLADGRADAVRNGLSAKKHAGTRVLSVENLFQASPDHIATLRDALADARVICFLRNPCEHLASFYKQLVRSKGLKADLATFIEKETRLIEEQPHRAYYAYDRKIAHWKTCFPGTHTASYKPSEMVERFTAFARLPRVDAATLPKRRNVSISPFIASLLTRLASIDGEGVAAARAFVVAHQGHVEYAFAEAVDYRPVDLTRFFAAFASRNPAAMAKHGFRLKPIERWPTAIRLADREILTRIEDAYRRRPPAPALDPAR